MIVERGEIYEIKIGCEGVGSEQRGNRYAVIVQNNTGNLHSSTTIVALITAQENKANIPTHVNINNKNSGIILPSTIMCEQIRTVDKKLIGKLIGKLNNKKLLEMNNSLSISFGL